MQEQIARILIADDDLLVLATLAGGLREAGFLVDEAADGEAAIEQGVDAPPDLAILDFRMPGASGIEVARRLREEAGVPCLFLSAYDDEAAVEMAVAEGALGYVVKPVSINQLIPAVRTALERSRDIGSLRSNEARMAVALERSRDISSAIGLVMSQLHYGREDAFEALRACARSQRRKLYEVTAELVDAQDRVNSLLGEVSTAFDQLSRARFRRSPRGRPE